MTRTSSIESQLSRLPNPRFRERLRGELVSRALPLDRVDARRIGIVADTHCHAADASDLPQAVLDAFAGVDLILHCGDLDELAVLDRLEEVAPVLAVRGPEDPFEEGNRLLDGPRVVEAAGHRIGMLANLEDARDPGLGSVFGLSVEVGVCGTTHRPRVEQLDDVVVVNPGSPRLPATGTPTVALLEFGDEGVEATIVVLTSNPPGETTEEST